jgi:hypothetical protein
MFVMFTDELFQGFETIYNTFTGLWYGQEKLGYPALLILLECCTINFCAADFSQGSLRTVAEEISKYKLHLVGVQEVR